ncbi:MAG: hypothetical protein ACM32E_03315 [Gemmatimonadota bacterium]
MPVMEIHGGNAAFELLLDFARSQQRLWPVLGVCSAGWTSGSG